MNDRASWAALRRALLDDTEPEPGMERRVLGAVRARPTARRARSTWALGAVAAALAILVVATLLLAGGVLRRTAVPAGRPAPSPTSKPATPPPLVSTHAMQPVGLDASGAGWVVEHLQPPPLVGGLTVLRTEDGGVHWASQLDLPTAAAAQLRAGPSGQALLYAMDFSTGTGAAAQPPRSFFYGTADGGAHWEQLPLPVSGLVQAVQIRDGREAWLTAEVATSRSGPPDQWVIYHTSDGARTWQRQATVDLMTTFGASNFGFSRQDDGQYSVVIPQIGGAAPSRLYTTSDGGAHWLGSPIPSIPGSAAGTGAPLVSVLPDGHLAVVGQGSLRVSDDGGQHWSEPRPLPPGATAGGVLGLDSSHWWLFTADGRVFSSADEGVSWGPAGQLPRGMTLAEAAFTSPTAGWATASYLRRGAANVLLVTADGGRTWRPIAPPHPYRPAVPCGGAGAAVTGHAHITVRYNGTPRANAVPAGLGVTDGCRFRLSTADASGTIDIAGTPAERGRVYTLGDLLDVWAIPDLASAAGVFGPSVRASVQVDGKPYAGDPRAIPLHDGTRVVIDATGPSGTG
jgi:photosystem II stability/assembly factor-like uncharacterized protein